MDAFNYIKPKLFSTLKHYSGAQFAKDLVAGIIVAIIALPLSIALAIASGVNPEQGLYTAVVAGFFYFIFRWQSCPNRWTNCSICCYHLRYYCSIWYGRSYYCNILSWYHDDYHGASSFWRFD